MTIRAGWIGCMLAAVLTIGGIAVAADAPWTPDQWKDESTVKLCTTCPDEGQYCFPVWLVVIDGNVYVRLGSKAADRMRKNTTAPLLPVEIGGHRFERVRATEAPEFVERVNQGMAAKYTSDAIIHLFSHPLTMRLTPEPAAAP